MLTVARGGIRLELEHMTRAIIEISLQLKENDVETNALNYGMVKGFLIGAGAPEAIHRALDGLENCPMPQKREEVAETIIEAVIPEPVPVAAEAEPHVPEPEPPAPKPRRKAVWTEDMRRAASERMKHARQARWNKPEAPVAVSATPTPEVSGPRRNRHRGYSGHQHAPVKLKGEITSYVDPATGKTVTKYPPAYAGGIFPGQTVMPKAGA